MSTFDQRAQEWDNGNVRVQGAKIIADAIAQNIPLNETMEVMDFGVGTGLLGFEIAKKVHQVYGVDTSAGMLAKLQEKNTTTRKPIIAIHQDILTQPLAQSFDVIVSSMTLHHIENLEHFFNTIYNMLNKEGYLALADLETEDGSFHSDNTGVFHFGFDEKKLIEEVKKAGFRDICFQTINTIKKPHKDFHVFLLTARK